MAGAVAVAAIAAAPGSAEAAGLSHDSTGISPNFVTYDAGNGEQNDLTISYDSGTDTYTLTDAGVATIDILGINPCSAVGNVATCSGSDLDTLHVTLRDGDDSATVISTEGDLGGILLMGGYGAETGTGNDTLDESGSSAPSGGLDGGDGDDTLIGSKSGRSTLRGSLGSDTLTGGPQQDLIWGDEGTGPSTTGGDDIIRAGGGNDQISPEAGADQVFGEGGDDWAIPTDLDGAPDLLDGGDGDDQLDAVSGPDTLRGGAGDDLLNTAVSTDDGAADDNSCGPGVDRVDLFPADIVAADCEQVQQVTVCPAGVRADCENTVLATSAPPLASQSAWRASGSWLAWGAPAAAAKAGKRRVVLGPKITVTVRPGRQKRVIIRLKAKEVRRALKGRAAVGGRIDVNSRSGKRKLRRKRTRFTLKQS